MMPWLRPDTLGKMLGPEKLRETRGNEHDSLMLPAQIAGPTSTWRAGTDPRGRTRSTRAHSRIAHAGSTEQIEGRMRLGRGRRTDVFHARHGSFEHDSICDTRCRTFRRRRCTHRWGRSWHQLQLRQTIRKKQHACRHRSQESGQGGSAETREDARCTPMRVRCSRARCAIEQLFQSVVRDLGSPTGLFSRMS